MDEPRRGTDPERPTLQRPVAQRGMRARSLAVVVAALAIVGAGAWSRMAEPRPRGVADSVPLPSRSVPVLVAQTPLPTSPRNSPQASDPATTRTVARTPGPAAAAATPGTDEVPDPPTGMLQTGDDGLVGGIGRPRRAPHEPAAPSNGGGPAGSIRAVVLVDGVQRAELVPVGGPNAMSAVLRLPGTNIAPAAVLRLVQDRADTGSDVLHEATVASESIPMPPAVPRRCALVAASRVTVDASEARGGQPVTFRYRAAVVVTSDARVLAVQLVRTEPLRTNLGEPPSTRPLCATTTR